MIRFYWAAAFLLISGSVFLGCSRSVDNVEEVVEDGSGTRGGNPIYGTVNGKNGNPVSGAEVSLIPIVFNPVADTGVDIKKDTTDSTGMFLLDEVDSGYYNIQINNQSDGTKAQQLNVAVFDSTYINTITLEVPGALSVRLSDSLMGTSGYVYIAGTEIYQHFTKEDEVIVVKDVPTGGTSKLIYVILDSTKVEKQVVHVADSVLIERQDTVFVHPYFEWKYSKRVHVNIPDSVQLKTPLLNFPTLIRLNNSNFNFSESDLSGKDFRITKSDGTNLPFDIQHWDATQGEALIWVTMDSVQKENNSEMIMYWDKDRADRKLNPSYAFDSAYGYVGVWHLDEAGGSREGGYKDASPYGNDGTGQNLHPLSNAKGVVSQAQWFDGNDDYINMPSQPQLNFGRGDFMISVNFYLDTLNGISQIVNKRLFPTGNYELQVMGKGYLRIYVRDTTGNDTLTSKDSIYTQTWYHAVVQRKSGVISMYVNGVDQENTIISNHDVSSTADLNIGRDGFHDQEYFPGIIDEVIISKHARSRDWIVLRYENLTKENNWIEIK